MSDSPLLPTHIHKHTNTHTHAHPHTQTCTHTDIHLWPFVIAAHGLTLSLPSSRCYWNTPRSPTEKNLHRHTRARAHQRTHTHTRAKTGTVSYKALTISLSAGHLVNSLRLTHTFTPSCASNTHMNQDYVRSVSCQTACGCHFPTRRIDNSQQDV